MNGCICVFLGCSDAGAENHLKLNECRNSIWCFVSVALVCAVVCGVWSLYSMLLLGCSAGYCSKYVFMCPSQRCCGPDGAVFTFKSLLSMHIFIKRFSVESLPSFAAFMNSRSV